LKNQNKLKVIRNFTKLYRLSICIFIELSAKNQIKIQFLGQRFDVFGFLSYWRIKHSYLIHLLSENSNFLWEMFFYVLNMFAKNNEKIQPRYNFSNG